MPDVYGKVRCNDDPLQVDQLPNYLAAALIATEFTDRIHLDMRKLDWNSAGSVDMP